MMQDTWIEADIVPQSLPLSYIFSYHHSFHIKIEVIYISASFVLFEKQLHRLSKAIENEEITLLIRYCPFLVH